MKLLPLFVAILVPLAATLAQDESKAVKRFRAAFRRGESIELLLGQRVDRVQSDRHRHERVIAEILHELLALGERRARVRALGDGLFVGEYFDGVKKRDIVIRGPLFRGRRVVEIWKLNTGYYDGD